MGILSNARTGTKPASTPKRVGILAKKRQIKTVQDKYWGEQLEPKFDVSGAKSIINKAQPKPQLDLVNFSQKAQQAMATAPELTPIDQRLHFGGEALKDDSRTYIGMNILPAYKEDNPLTKIGKGIVNYGIGGPLSLVSNATNAPQQAMMQTSRAMANAIQGKPQDFSEMTLRKDVLPPAYDKALKELAAKSKGGNIAAQGVDMFVNTALDPTTYIMGGIVDDMARAGIIGKASKPSTEMVRVLGESQQKVLAKMKGALRGTVQSVDEAIPLEKVQAVKPTTRQGNFKIKNTAYDDVAQEYNDAIEAIQNHFRTNELRMDEIPLIKSELGIDLDDIINRMEQAEKGVQLPGADAMRLKRAAGAASDRTYNLADNVRLQGVGGKTDDVNPLGGKLPKAEPKPLGGELPKQKVNGIPIGEKPLSFPATVAKSDLAADELKQMIKDNPLSYKPVNNPDTLKYAQEIVDQNFEAAKRVVKEGESFSNATESAMAQDVIRRLQNNKQWDEAFEVMEATARKAKTSGQTIQAFSMWRRMTPEGMLRYADKVIKDTGGKMTGDFADKLTEAMKRIEAATDENTLKNTIMRQAGEMPEWAYKSMNSKTADQLKDIAMAQVLSDIADQVPKSAWKKLSTVQAMSHLINVKTAARNVLGNLSFGAAEKLSNAIAMPFDAIGSLFTGKRTLTMPKVKGTFKAGFDKAKEAAFDASMELDRTGVSAGKYNVPIGGSFKGRLGRAGEKALKYELNVPDEFFKGQVYDDVLKQQMAAAKVTEATQEMMEYATARAKYATFQDDSLPARILQGTKDILNNIGGGTRRVGKSGIKTREFGAGDLLIKYTTVPGNLISRSVEYTPAGLLKILSIAKDANLSGAMKQSEIAMTIGRSITGTGMIAAGAALRRKGLIISQDTDRGRNAQSLDQAEGLGNYKVNISAVERMLDGGDTAPQDGDTLYSYNWIEPLGVQLAIGAEIDKEMQKGGKVPDIAFNAGNAAMEEILDLPTLSVIRQMTYQNNAFDVVITPLVQGASGFVPSPIRQYAQMDDTTARLTKGSTPIGGAWNRVKSALPEVRKGLEPKIDPFGREVKYPGGVFNSLINPGQTNTYRPSEVTPQLKQLEDLTGQTDFYPRDSAPFSFTHNKQPVVLTPQEKTIYMKMEGEEVLRRYKEILAKGVSNANAEQQRKELNKAKTKASKMARDEILKRRGLK